MVKATVSGIIDKNRVLIVNEQMGIQKEAGLTRHTKDVKVGDKVICLTAADMEEIAIVGVIE